ncbi:S-layer homology domain-containing protein [Collinsella tanakaei]|nr:S-layer homology domain-containing protein [Collinsella tanakaei]
MNGYEGSDKFGVGDPLTREQFACIIANAAGADLSEQDTSVLDGYVDGDGVSDWARPAVAWAVETGVINGVEGEDGTRTLDAVRDITRAEMAAMMLNAVDAGALVEG